MLFVEENTHRNGGNGLHSARWEVFERFFFLFFVLGHGMEEEKHRMASVFVTPRNIRRRSVGGRFCCETAIQHARNCTHLHVHVHVRAQVRGEWEGVR